MKVSNLQLVKNPHILNEGILYTSYSYKIPSPVGTVFVFVTEVNNEPKFVQLFIGKAGTEVRANAYALESLANEILKEFNGFNRLMLHLCDISTDKARYINQIKVRSLPEAFYTALSMYRTMKYPSNTSNNHRPSKINHARQRGRSNRSKLRIP